MTHTEPDLVTPKLLDELRQITPYDPQHLPLEIELIEAFCERYPTLPQVACFDTAFHDDASGSQAAANSAALQAKGVHRYGFHGLSYQFVGGTYRIGDPAATKGRVILAHLGNGASLAAVHSGRASTQAWASHQLRGW